MNWDEKKPKVFPVGLHSTWGSGLSESKVLGLEDSRALGWCQCLGWGYSPRSLVRRNKIPFSRKFQVQRVDCQQCCTLSAWMQTWERNQSYLLPILYTQGEGICLREPCRSPSGVTSSSALRADRKFPRICFLISSGKPDNLISLHAQPILLPSATPSRLWVPLGLVLGSLFSLKHELSWEPRI